MRRPATASLATLLTATLLLAGCSGEPDDAPETEPTGQPTEESSIPEPSEEDVASLDDVTVEGDIGAAPTVTFDQPFDVTAPVARVETEGTGEPLEAGQEIEMNYVAHAGDDGRQLVSTWELGSPERLTFSDSTLVPVLSEAFTGQNVGSRILFAVPRTEAQEATELSPEIAEAPATVMALEIVSAGFPRAEGEAVEPPEGLPTVELAENGEPEITIPEDATEPDELVVQPLIKGDGPVVESGQQVRMHYKGTLWDGTVFDQSWGGPPFGTTQPLTIGAGQVIEGWDEGLVGQTVGSQVLLVIPPEKGYGSEEQGSIPADSTLVFVVDIIEATGPA